MKHSIQSPIDVADAIHYEFDPLSQPLGKGGMGTVFKGVCIEERTGRQIDVAIKRIEDRNNPEIVERARREASIQINSDYLVRMYSFIEEDTSFGDKVYYIISEYLDGVSLSDILEGRYCNVYGNMVGYAAQIGNLFQNNRKKAALIIIQSVMNAISVLHDNGYIHRDVDPSNIMVTSDGKIKLIDFGIAKKVSALGSYDRALTNSGVFVGKVEYAAPELVLGDIDRQNVTTDIYSLGVLLYQLLVGNIPFTGAKHEIMYAQVHTKPDLRKVQDNHLRGIIRKAMSKDQSKRYSSVILMRAALDEEKQSLPVPYIVGACAVAVLALVVVLLRPSEVDLPYPDDSYSSISETLSQSQTQSDSCKEDIYVTSMKQLTMNVDSLIASNDFELIRKSDIYNNLIDSLKINSSNSIVLYNAARIIQALNAGGYGDGLDSMQKKIIWGSNFFPEQAEIKQNESGSCDYSQAKLAYVCLVRALENYANYKSVDSGLNEKMNALMKSMKEDAKGMFLYKIEKTEEITD